MSDGASDLKRCSRCRHTRPIGEFSRQRASKDGHQAHCKPCRSKILRLWRQANAERVASERHARTLDGRSRIATRRYRIRNRERLKAAREAEVENRRQVRLAHLRETAEERRRQRALVKVRWKRKNRDRAKVYKHRNRAKRYAAPGSHSAEDIRVLLKRQCGKCAICGGKLGDDREVDHIVPIAKGGSNSRRNLQLTHGHCNRSKNAKDPIEFMRSRGLLL